MGSFWNHFGIILGSLWDHHGIIIGSFWNHFGIILESFWDHFGIILGSFWDHFGIILGSFWDNSGTIFGSFSSYYLSGSFVFLAQKFRRRKYSVGGASDVLSACFFSFSCDVIFSGVPYVWIPPDSLESIAPFASSLRSLAHCAGHGIPA